jgi:hypothetical protein
MKRIILIAILLLSYAGTNAQITLTASNNLDVGDTYQYDIFDEVSSLDLGTTGSGNSWDFSGISGIFIEGIPAECVHPAGTPFADSAAVADANICTKPAGSLDGAYAYYNQNSSHQVLLAHGHYATGNISFANYYDDLVGMELPFTYGDTYMDGYDVKIYNVTAGGYLMRDSGTIYTEADAYGALITPAGTYNNVLRVTTTTTSFTWMNFAGVWTFTGMSSTINYDWFAEGIKVPVMSVTEFVGSTGYSTKYLSDYNFPVGIREEKLNEFDLYPNPAINQITIRCSSDIQEWKVISMNGQVLDEGRNARRSKSYYLSLSALNPGMYLLEIRYPDGAASRKCFVKR